MNEWKRIARAELSEFFDLHLESVFKGLLLTVCVLFLYGADILLRCESVSTEAQASFFTPAKFTRMQFAADHQREELECSETKADILACGAWSSDEHYFW